MSQPVPLRDLSAPRPTGSWLRGVCAALAAASLLALTACSSAAQRFDDAIGQGIAAVETARLAVDQELTGRALPTVTTTALGDARRELIDATTSVSETDAASPDEDARRTKVLDALAGSVHAVNDARDAMAGIGSLDAAVGPLDEAAAALEELEAQSAADPGAGAARGTVRAADGSAGGAR